MAIGIHTIYAGSFCDENRRQHWQDYFIGQFTGDPYLDDAFDRRLKRVEKRMAQKFGYGNFTWYWSPIPKPYNPLTPEQRYQRMVSKARNEYENRCNIIQQGSTLFAQHLLAEEKERLNKRIETLKMRYNIVS